jgi:hypothetical protein
MNSGEISLSVCVKVPSAMLYAFKDHANPMLQSLDLPTASDMKRKISLRPVAEDLQMGTIKPTSISLEVFV